MTEKYISEVKKFVNQINESVSDIENGRFYIDFEVREKIGDNFVKIIIADNKNNTKFDKFFHWYVLKCRDGSKIYPNDIFTWLNNTIVENREH